MKSEFKIKVCGMRDAENMSEVASLSVDYLGFIFFPQSPRYVGDDFSMPEMKRTLKTVGVFVNESVESVMNNVDKHRLDFVQLHGDESVELCEALKAKDIKVIKVFPVDGAFDFQTAEPFQDVVDYFLFDTKGRLRGGNGQTFNWEALRKYNQKKPFFLSGGLSQDTLADLHKLKDMNIHALDLNSGVEVSPGLKDIGKIKSIQLRLKEIYEIHS